MNFDEYFKNRVDLVGRALLDARAEKLLVPHWRFYAAGLLCIAVATAAVLWASVTHADAGFFARTTLFLSCVLFAGVWLLTIAQAAQFALARITVKSHDAVREKTLAQLLKIDSTLAHQAMRRSS